MPNLMLSWQQAVLLAAWLGAADLLLTHVGHAADRAGHWTTRAGPFFKEAGIIALYALWQLAGNLASGGSMARSGTHGGSGMPNDRSVCPASSACSG